MRPQHLPVLPVLTACAAYLNSFWGVFQFDDYNVIVDNPVVHSWSAWFSDLFHGIRPVLKFTYLLNWSSDMGIFGFHLFNTIIHLANVLLFSVITMKFTEYTSARHSPSPFVYPAFWAALLFALHPVQTEAVTYISGRSSSLMTLFYLGSMLAYIRGSALQKSFWRSAISPALFLLAVLTKEVAVTLPFALLLWERACHPDTSLREALRLQKVHWLLLLGIFIMLMAHAGYTRLLEAGFHTRGVQENLYSQINAVMYLISRLVLVNRLNIDPDLPVITSWSLKLFGEFLLLLVLLLSGFLSLKKRPWFGFGILWFFLHLLPTNSVVPRLDVVNERQLYLASCGLFLAFATEGLRLYDVLRQKQRMTNVLVVSLSIALIAAIGLSTVARNHVYRSEIDLWVDVTLKSPNKARGYNNLGYALALSGRTDDAKRAYATALRLMPDYELASANLALISSPETSLLPRR